jgi:hypothetical protein
VQRVRGILEEIAMLFERDGRTGFSSEQGALAAQGTSTSTTSRSADAEPLYTRSLAIREKTLGPNHRRRNHLRRKQLRTELTKSS